MYINLYYIYSINNIILNLFNKCIWILIEIFSSLKNVRKIYGIVFYYNIISIVY